MRSRPETPEKYHRLEAELDSFDDSVRERALASLCEQVTKDGVTWPAPGRFFNLHCHSIFSYNPDAHSPSKLAWLARWAGLEMSGLVDFDVLDGLDEFLAATDRLEIKACVSIESRTYVPEFSDRVMNSPGEPGVAYFLGAGFTTTNLTGDTLAFLNGLRDNAARRNRELVDRVNAYTNPVTLDYEADVGPLTPRGNATERHLCEAYARKAAAHFSAPGKLAAYWTEKLGVEADTLDLPTGPKLQAAIRAKTMKRGGVGYVQPDAGSFPLLADMSHFIREAGAIPTLAWLDGTTEGEQALAELFETGLKHGVSAVFLVPDRNFTAGVKDEKLKNLNEFVALAEQHHFPVIAGTEMNSPGQRFADDFDAKELRPLVPVFRKGAHILYAHTVLQRKAGMGYLSDWALKHFPERKERNIFFEKLGRDVKPEREPSLHLLNTQLSPDEVLGLSKEVDMPDVLPKTQRALQLVGPDQLALNDEKAVFEPGPYQVLGRIEVVGLCFSDLKLLKQFSGHVRKSEIISGLDTSVLSEVPSYVPGDKPVVPGHEAVVRVVAVGDKVTQAEVGKRYLVQTDYRWLATAQSNAAFGYNFEGGLQEYVLVDERVITSPEGESMLIPAQEDLAASAIALVEPWACVEDSYAMPERQTIKAGGQLLVAVSEGTEIPENLREVITSGSPSGIQWLGDNPDADATVVDGVDAIDEESLDDVLFLGADADLIEKLFPKVAARGIVNIVQCGQTFGREVNSPVGRVHYGGVRLAGTAGSNPADGYDMIPATGEIRPNDRIDTVGAAGPMGTMHVIRNLCQGVPGVTVYGGDMSHERLDMLTRLAVPLAEANNVTFEAYHAQENPPPPPFNYSALMVPAPGLVAHAVTQMAEHGIINIFAGIPAQVYHPLDLDTYVAKQLYFIGTSGSVLEDMKIVLKKVEDRRLDTNLSVAAVSGLDGAAEGIRAVEKQLMPGKIIVYPSCEGLGLTPLTELAQTLPEVAAKLKDGTWTAEAEQALLKKFSAN